MPKSIYTPNVILMVCLATTSAHTSWAATDEQSNVSVTLPNQQKIQINVTESKRVGSIKGRIQEQKQILVQHQKLFNTTTQTFLDDDDEVSSDDEIEVRMENNAGKGTSQQGAWVLGVICILVLGTVVVYVFRQKAHTAPSTQRPATPARLGKAS